MIFTNNLIKKKKQKTLCNTKNNYYYNVNIPIVDNKLHISNNNINVSVDNLDNKITNNNNYNNFDIPIINTPIQLSNENINVIIEQNTNLDISIKEEIPIINSSISFTNDKNITVKNNLTNINSNNINNNIINNLDFTLNTNVNNNLHNIEYVEVINNNNNNSLDIDIDKNISKKIIGNTIIDKLNDKLINKSDDNLLDNNVIFKKEIDQYKLKIIKNSNVIITNVYQEKYINNINASGFGDFLRGSYFLIQFCLKYNLKFNINLTNHQLNLCLNTYQTNKLINTNITPFIYNNYIPNIINNTVYAKTDINIESYFVDYLYDELNKISDINTNKIINLNIYTISLPNLKPSYYEKYYIKNILKPNTIIIQKINNIINNNNIIPKQFNVIHIRIGDQFIINNETTISYKIINNLFNELDNLLLNIDVNKFVFLLFADNNIIKKLIIEKYKFIKTFFNKITHLGEGVISSYEEIENTMIEFYIMSISSNIFCYSVYEHGSGFSRWCAETYNIPYICKYINY